MSKFKDSTIGEIVQGIVTIALLVGLLFSVNPITPSSELSGSFRAGAIGTNPVENYIPIIKYNEGYYSTYDITTTGTITGAIASITGAVSLGSTLAVTGAVTQTNDYYSVGGIDYASVQQTLTTATTTPCSLANPWLGTASTTPLWVYFDVTTGTSTAMTFDIATSTSPNATSTPALVKGAALAANAKGSFYWTPDTSTTSPGVLDTRDYTTGLSNLIMGPNEYLNIDTAGTTAYTYVGTCSALFMKP